jgi:hypothetical protein
MAKLFPLALLALFAAVVFIGQGQAQKADLGATAQIPKTWDEAALSEWALPLAGLGQPPTYISADYFYRMPERPIYRGYPVYAPGKEPPGYMDWLRRQEPEVVFDPAKLKTEADWIKAGEMVFNAPVVAPLWVTGTVEDLRDPAYFKAVNPLTAADGTLPYLRYSISRKGEVGVALLICASCHTRVLPDGKVVTGAPGNHREGRRQAYNMRRLGEEEWCSSSHILLKFFTIFTEVQLQIIRPLAAVF